MARLRSKWGSNTSAYKLPETEQMKVKKDQIVPVFRMVRICGRSYNVVKDPTRLSLSTKRPSVLTALNAEKLMGSRDITKLVGDSGVYYADGLVAEFLFRLSGFRVKRVPGVELWLKILDECPPGCKLYVIGGTARVNAKTVKRVSKDFPEAQIVGARNGYFSQDDVPDLIVDLQAKRPDIVLVAMGSPKQEVLMKEFAKNHPALYVGLGGSFDVYTGVVKRAPVVFRATGTEWLYRFACEPSRIVRFVRNVTTRPRKDLS